MGPLKKKKWLLDFAQNIDRWVACAIVAHTCRPLAGIVVAFIVVVIITVVFGEGMLARRDVRASEVATETSHRCDCFGVGSLFSRAVFGFQQFHDFKHSTHRRLTPFAKGPQRLRGVHLPVCRPKDAARI